MSKGLKELKEIELKWQYGVFTFIPNFEIIEKELKDLDTIKKIFDDYGLPFKLTTLREAVFLLKQLQSEKSQCWDNALKKLKALEIIKNIGILKPYETIGGQCWLETICDATKITKDNYDLLKEVGL